MQKVSTTSAVGAVVLSCGVVVGGTAGAVPFTAIQIFGDSFSDTGAGFALTDGGTTASYLAEFFGNPVVLPDAPNPGMSSINFAESGARVDVQSETGPTSLTNQVDNYVNLVETGEASFDPASTLFFLSGGLNDHLEPAENVTSAYREQVADLVDLGARYVQIAILPRLVPPFEDSADNLNPAYQALVPELDTTYPGVSVTLSNWGYYYDDIIEDPASYGFTNVTDPCRQGGFGGGEVTICDTPETYFYYWIVHPSDAAHRVVAERLYDDLIALPAVPAPVPLPASAVLLGGAMLGFGAFRRSAGRVSAA